MNIKQLRTALLLLGTICTGQQLFCAAESDLDAALRASLASEQQEKRNQRDLQQGIKASRLLAQEKRNQRNLQQVIEASRLPAQEEKEMAAILEKSRQSAAREAEARTREQAHLRQQPSAGQRKTAPAQAPRHVAARIEACQYCGVERPYTGSKNMFITDNKNKCLTCDNNTFMVIESQAAQRQEAGLQPRRPLARQRLLTHSLIPVNRQKYGDCGLHAIANAASVNECINRGQPVEARLIQEYNPRFYNQGAKELGSLLTR